MELKNSAMFLAMLVVISAFTGCVDEDDDATTSDPGEDGGYEYATNVDSHRLLVDDVCDIKALAEEAKWSEIKKAKTNLKLHMIGKLQSNKAKKAIEVFDYIHSLDNQKLADNLSKFQISLNKSVSYFIQVNIGNEVQKSGIPYHEVDAFYNYCTIEKKMNVIGLMAIPPNDSNTEKYFKILSELNASLGFHDLSMGMSSDYMLAVNYNATYLRIGSSIFGERS